MGKIALTVDEKEKTIKSSQGRAQGWWGLSQMEWEWHEKVAWKSNEDTTPIKWKTSTNEDKWRKEQQNEQKWTKTSGGSPKQVQSLIVVGLLFYLFVIIDDY